MKSLTDCINESVKLEESNEMNFDDVLLELQIIGFKVKENKTDGKYTATKNGEYDMEIKKLNNTFIEVSTSRDAHKEKTKYTYTEFVDDMVVNSL